MNKRDLARELARNRGMPPDRARAFIDAFVRSVERALTEGQPVTLRKFGRFDVRPRARRMARVPGGSESTLVPARLAPVFRSAPGLGRRVTEGTGASSKSGR
jgi:DNA-binding protein HU-beta